MKMVQLISQKLWAFRHPIKWLRMLVVQVRAANAVAARKLQHPGCEHALNVWPPVEGVTEGYEVDGDTTVSWGTDELLQSPKPASGFAIVLRCSEKELVDINPLPNGTGINVSRVRLKQGGSWNLVCRDNTDVTWPKIGGTVSVVDMSGHFGTIGLRYTATVVENDYEAALKTPGERTMVVEKMTLIETGGGSAQVG